MIDKSTQEAYDALRFYTLSHPSPEFVHQYVVDVWAAQYADEHTKPITLVFGLVGLYLHLEKGYTGKEVQNAHIKLTKHKKRWPEIHLPEERGKINVFDVMSAEPGPERDKMIDVWCISVWKAYEESFGQIEAYLQNNLFK